MRGPGMAFEDDIPPKRCRRLSLLGVVHHPFDVLCELPDVSGLAHSQMGAVFKEVLDILGAYGDRGFTKGQIFKHLQWIERESTFLR